MEVASRRWGNGARVDSVSAGKKRLLSAAITCFVSKGIRATTIEDVANAANVTRRTVYRYYNGKSELISAVIELERSQLFKQLQQACEPHQNDFIRMLVECAARAAEVLSISAGSQNLLSGENAANAPPQLLSEDSYRDWETLFDEAYQGYRRTHPEVYPLSDIIELTGRLVLSFPYVPSDPDSIRRAIRAFMSLNPSNPVLSVQ
ncbi:MAG: AcrR family transcriptional regulator [Bermanella sp.]|jgi:AcrR family transcriptional regulator